MQESALTGGKKPIDKKAVESQLERISKTEKKSPNYDAAEARRRVLNRVRATQASNLDLDFAMLPQRDLGELADFVERIETLEALSTREPDRIESVGTPGMNDIERHVFGERPAYVKGQNGEALYKIKDGTTSTVVKLEWDGKRKQWVEKEDPELDPKIQDYILDTERNRQQYIQDVADYYGIDPSEVPILKARGIPVRIGIEAGSGPLNEYASSRVDQLLNFGVVPLTVVRESNDGTELRSIQEAAPSKNPDNPTREMSPDDFRDLLTRGPNHPAAKSLMHIAVLHKLRPASDGHIGNVLYDPDAQQFYAIDNGLSGGLSRQTAAGQRIPVDNLVSVPLEVVMKFPDWKLDDEALGNMQKLYDSLVAYAELRRQKPGTLEESEKMDLEKVEKGKEARALSDLFRMVYGHDKIADVELGAFLTELKKIIDDGRPSVDPRFMRRLEPHLAAPASP
ncbi:hypothetical protein HZC53_00715 [Candidatus Uhrbacteria bacterium]|nr:hypothetical protein [Candidatus Uhrbacteria bacterium]